MMEMLRLTSARKYSFDKILLSRSEVKVVAPCQEVADHINVEIREKYIKDYRVVIHGILGWVHVRETVEEINAQINGYPAKMEKVPF